MTVSGSAGGKRVAQAENSAGDERVATEQNPVQMVVIWVIGGVVIAAAAVVAGWLLARRRRDFVRRRDAGDPLSGLVVDALGSEWADRTGSDIQAVRSAVLRGEPAPLRIRLADLVDEVTVGFEADGAGPVRVSVQCRYADGVSAATITTESPWENVPQEVRAQFLRSGEKVLRRPWKLS